MTEYKDCVMVFAEQNNGKIHPVSYELLNKGKDIARKKNCKLVSTILGDVTDEKVELIYYGADAVICPNDNEEFNEPNENVYAKALYSIVKEVEPSVLLIGATNFGRSLAPKTASLLSCGLTADCVELDVDDDGGLIQIRPAFSENILAHIKSREFPQMATVRYKEFDKAERDETREVKIVEVDTGERIKSSVKIIEKIVTEKVDLANANVVVAGGRGIKEPKDFELLYNLASKIDGAVVGASRPIVEDGFISKAHQVGYSGHRVKPKLYIACGVSGAPQHLAGMKESEYIIAINKDASAPIFEIADIGIIGDLYEILPELIKELEE